MHEADLILAQLSSVRNELREAFVRIDDSFMDWAPADGMRTVKGQLVEIISTESNIIEKITGNQNFDFAKIEKEINQNNSCRDFDVLLASSRQKTINLIEQNRNQLDRIVQTSKNFLVYLELDAIPMGELFRYIARHESYHCGQLVSYLWARGDNPYDWETP